MTFIKENAWELCVTMSQGSHQDFKLLGTALYLQLVGGVQFIEQLVSYNSSSIVKLKWILLFIIRAINSINIKTSMQKWLNFEVRNETWIFW